MATHDADQKKANDEFSSRATMTTDPNAKGVAIAESGRTDAKGNAITEAGNSTHLTACVDGKWYVVNTRREKLIDKAFATESEATDEAQKHNAKVPKAPPTA